MDKKLSGSTDIRFVRRKSGTVGGGDSKQAQERSWKLCSVIVRFMLFAKKRYLAQTSLEHANDCTSLFTTFGMSSRTPLKHYYLICHHLSALFFFDKQKGEIVVK